MCDPFDQIRRLRTPLLGGPLLWLAQASAMPQPPWLLHLRVAWHCALRKRKLLELQCHGSSLYELHGFADACSHNFLALCFWARTHTPSWPCRTCKLYIAYHSSVLQFAIASTPLSWCLPYEIKSQERSWNDLDFNIFQCMAGGLPNLYLPLVGCPCLGDSHRVFPWRD